MLRDVLHRPLLLELDNTSVRKLFINNNGNPPWHTYSQGGFFMDKIFNFLTTTEGAWDDGSVKLTSIGVILVAICIFALIIIPAITNKRNKENKKTLTTKQLTYSAVALALAMVCSMIKFANLPMGGSCTLCSIDW